MLHHCGGPGHIQQQGEDNRTRRLFHDRWNCEPSFQLNSEDTDFFEQVCFIASNLLICPALLSGVGCQDRVFNFADHTNGAKWVVIWELIFVLSTVPVRISICLSLLQQTQSRVYKRIARGLIGLIIIAAFVQLVWIALACQPIFHAQDSVDQTTTCGRSDGAVALSYVFAGTSICINICIAVFPVFIFSGTRK